MRKLPAGLKFTIEISTLDDRYVANAKLEHKSDTKICIESRYEAKNIKKLSNFQKDALLTMLKQLYRNDPFMLERVR